jgi:hypothetical protein
VLINLIEEGNEGELGHAYDGVHEEEQSKQQA